MMNCTTGHVEQLSQVLDGPLPGGMSGALTQGDLMTAELPLGAIPAADASQTVPNELMKNSYGALSGADANYQQSREALTDMLSLANQKGSGGAEVGLLPEGISTRISPDAAKHQKLHATYVALQGKALASGGADAVRATIDEAVPTYDKPQTAITSGLTTQLNNLDLGHIKTQFLAPLYQRSNEKAFMQQSAAFDQNVKPSMIPALQLSGDQQRTIVGGDCAMRACAGWFSCVLAATTVHWGGAVFFAGGSAASSKTKAMPP
jgi:hypothetical protein